MKRRMKLAISQFLSFVLLGILPNLAVASDTLVISVASARSHDQNMPALRYTEEDAIRFHEAMSLVGHVPQSSNFLLTSGNRQELLRLVERKGLNSAGKYRKLVFYFAGHSDHRGLHFVDGTLSQSQLQDSLATVYADFTLAVFDSCHAGGPQHRGQATQAQMATILIEQDEPTGQVILSASQPVGLAYESYAIKGGLFTHNLVNGLYGKADANRDGEVTLWELYDYSYRETKLASLTSAVRTVQKPWFSSNLKGSGEITLSYPKQVKSRLRITDIHHSPLLLVDHKGQTISLAAQQKPHELVLSPGKYLLLQHKAGQRRYARLQLAAGEIETIGPRQLQPLMSNLSDTRGDFRSLHKSTTLSMDISRLQPLYGRYRQGEAGRLGWLHSAFLGFDSSHPFQIIFGMQALQFSGLLDDLLGIGPYAESASLLPIVGNLVFELRTSIVANFMQQITKGDNGQQRRQFAPQIDFGGALSLQTTAVSPYLGWRRLQILSLQDNGRRWSATHNLYLGLRIRI